MRTGTVPLALLSTLSLCGMLLTTGCSRTKASKENFKAAIGNYYNAHPECIWSSPVKFPQEVDAGKDSQTTGYDALYDAGLLTRVTQQKKEFIFATKQVTVYDLSSKGRSVFTPDQSQPGYANFCFGHRDVATINNFTTSADNNSDQIANVDYTYSIDGAPDWARSGEVQTAFPIIQADLSGNKVAQATLINTRDGWQVSHN